MPVAAVASAKVDVKHSSICWRGMAELAVRTLLMYRPFCCRQCASALTRVAWVCQQSISDGVAEFAVRVLLVCRALCCYHHAAVMSRVPGSATKMFSDGVAELGQGCQTCNIHSAAFIMLLPYKQQQALPMMRQ